MDIPRFGLGTVPLGNYRRAISDADAHALVRHAWAAGVRGFDTAPLYGSGLAETRLGDALAGVDRAGYVLSTKVGRVLRADAPPDPSLLDGDQPIYRDIPALHPVPDFSRDGVRRSLAESLVRLRTDRVDVVYLHDPEGHERAVIEEGFPALEELRRAGTVGAIGVGSTDVATMTTLVRELPLDCLMLASRWTLLDRSAEPDLLPLCARRGVRVVAAGVFNSGILADPRPGTMFHYRTAPAAVLARVHALAARTEALGVPLAAAAIQFPGRHPAVAGLVVGAQTPAELDEDLALLAMPVPPRLWAALG